MLDPVDCSRLPEYLVDLAPLASFLFHKPAVDARHDLVELGAGES